MCVYGNRDYFGATMPTMMGNKDVAERLVRLRDALGIPSQTAMAARLKVDVDRYHVAERTGRLSKDMAILICQKCPGVTLDWLFLGNLAGMPYELVNRISGLPSPSQDFTTLSGGGRAGRSRKR